VAIDPPNFYDNRNEQYGFNSTNGFGQTQANYSPIPTPSFTNALEATNKQ
jgi:hypothetical protein